MYFETWAWTEFTHRNYGRANFDIVYYFCFVLFFSKHKRFFVLINLQEEFSIYKNYVPTNQHDGYCKWPIERAFSNSLASRFKRIRICFRLQRQGGSYSWVVHCGDNRNAAGRPHPQTVPNQWNEPFASSRCDPDRKTTARGGGKKENYDYQIIPNRTHPTGKNRNTYWFRITETTKSNHHETHENSFILTNWCVCRKLLVIK